MSAPLTIAEASRRIAAKTLSPVELAQDCLERSKRLNPTLHAYITITEDRALADAKRAEARIMHDGPCSPLDGIPIAHKDIYNTAGILTTAHSKLLQDNVPTKDATTVAKLAAAGTIMLGKLSTHEFAMGGPSFDLPWPPARNPWDPEYFTSGSSSGTAAAVATGMAMGGTGSDTGGSIRGPAALCGISGIKPTYGRCSRAGVLPLAFTLDHTGPMAWTAEDCAMLLQEMAGYDPADPASADQPVPDFRADLGLGAKGLRIGVIRSFHETEHKVSPATLKGIEAAIDAFRKLGASVRDVSLSPLADYGAANFVILISEAVAVHEPWMRTRLNDYGERLRDRLALGAMLRSSDYMQAIRRRRELLLEMIAAMEDLDILITAAAPGEAPKIMEVPKWSNMDKPGFTGPWNLTGFPAISVCTGFGEAGLPVAVQLVAKPFQEPTLFRAAHVLEEAMPWRESRPALAGELAASK